MDKAYVLGQSYMKSYMKVLEYSWRLGTGCIVSLQSTCMKSDADAFAKAPNSAREQREIIEEET